MSDRAKYWAPVNLEYFACTLRVPGESGALGLKDRET